MVKQIIMFSCLVCFLCGMGYVVDLNDNFISASHSLCLRRVKPAPDLTGNLGKADTVQRLYAIATTDSSNYVRFLAKKALDSFIPQEYWVGNWSEVSDDTLKGIVSRYIEDLGTVQIISEPSEAETVSIASIPTTLKDTFDTHLYDSESLPTPETRETTAGAVLTQAQLEQIQALLPRGFIPATMEVDYHTAYEDMYGYKGGLSVTVVNSDGQKIVLRGKGTGATGSYGLGVFYRNRPKISDFVFDGLTSVPNQTGAIRTAGSSGVQPIAKSSQIDGLIEKLNSEDKDQVILALTRTGRMSPEEVRLYLDVLIPAVITSMDDSDLDTQAEAILAVGNIIRYSSDEAVKANVARMIAAKLDAPDYSVRLCADTALYVVIPALGDEALKLELGLKLVDAAKDSDSKVAVSALNCLYGTANSFNPESKGVLLTTLERARSDGLISTDAYVSMWFEKAMKALRGTPQ